MKKTRDQIQNDALKIMLPLHRCGAGITMGGGKTLLGLRHMAEHYTEQARFLIVAPKKSIWKEWKDQAVQHKLEYLVDHMEFTTYLSLHKQDFDFDVVYLDECHSLLETHEEWLEDYKNKIVGLSGTPPKYSGSEKGSMVNHYCPIVYEYHTDTAIDDKILNDYRIYIHKLRLDPLKTIKVERGGKSWYTSEVATYEYWTNRLTQSGGKTKEIQIMRVMRMKAMMDFPSKEKFAQELLNKSKHKTILFANTQQQADRLCKHSYHSNNPLSEDCLEAFKTGKIDKLSCVLQLSEGVNIPNLKEGIIMHAYGNERKSSQRIGRLLRLNPKEKSVIHILCYEDTVDEHWVQSALENFDQSKIIYVS